MNNILIPLKSIGLLSVSGSEAGEFLHAMLTRDMLTLEDEETRLAAWCNPKGRVITLVRVCLKDATYYLRLPQSLAGPVSHKLQMYTLGREARVENLSETAVIMLHQGDGQVTAQHIRMTLPALTSWDELFFISGEPPETEPAEKQHEIINQYRIEQIRNGIPEILEQTTEHFIPQMLNLHNLQALDFNKGCYPGQEIVTRLHHRGEVKRHLCYAELACTEEPVPGTRIHTESGKNIGELVNAAKLGTCKHGILCVLKSDGVSGGTLICDGSELQNLKRTG